jgi:hypothetical protein
MLLDPRTPTLGGDILTEAMHGASNFLNQPRPKMLIAEPGVKYLPRIIELL